MIDTKAFYQLSYGMYIIAAKDGDTMAGCVVNTFQQVTSSPLQVSVALNKENVTTGVVRAAGRFTATCLSEEAAMELIGAFGFRTSADFDKFSACAADFDAAGMPYVAEQSCARFSARVVQEVDLGTHVLFVGEVEEAACCNGAAPMTYAYYHQVKGGKTPPKASSYLGDGAAAAAASAPVGSSAPADGSMAEESLAADSPSAAPAESSPSAEAPAAPKYAWLCPVCGHMEYADELPDDYECPVCGVGKEMFERVAV